MTRRTPPPLPIIRPEVRDQLTAVYAVMSEAAGWRPYSEADDLAGEAREWAETFWTDEQDSRFDLGRPAHADRPAIAFIVEAARAARVGDRAAARDLLDLARIELAVPEPSAVAA